MTVPTPASVRYLAACILITFGMPARLVFADYRDELGYTRLQAELGAAAPNGTGVSVTQTEASSGGFNYMPDVLNVEFTGKTIYARSTAGGVTGHATTVGAYFYGLSSSMAPGVNSIDVFEADNWLHSGFLRRTSASQPNVENRAVQNHSWVGSFDSGGAGDVEVLRRLDFAIARDDFLAVVGLNNGSGNNHPALLGNIYNGISVGLTNGGHSSGASTVDGTGRVKPEIVSPIFVTSFATPTIGAAAALLIQKARSSAPLADAERSVMLKAILLAGATKQPFAGWNRTTTRPLDAHFGAGQVNVYRSYHVLTAGKQPASSSATVPPRGWNYAQTTAAPQRYFFDIPPGNTAPDFSALLTWNRTVTAAWPLSTSSLPNLSLKLYAASGFTTGALIDSSESPVDNLEHLYLPGLAPGRYALEVTAPIAGVSYGLAWYSQPTISVTATTPEASEFGVVPGGFTITRAGDTADPLQIRYVLSGAAVNGADYTALPGSVTIPAGASSAQIPLTPIDDSTAEGDETATLTLAGDFAYSIGGTPSAAVTIHDRPIDEWRYNVFTAAELADPAISGDLGDADHDGLVNRFEYGVGLNPKRADAAEAFVAQLTPAGYLALTYTRPVRATDVDYIVEVAEALPFWRSGAGHTIEAQAASTDLTETRYVQSANSTSSVPQQFIRLRIERK